MSTHMPTPNAAFPQDPRPTQIKKRTHAVLSSMRRGLKARDEFSQNVARIVAKM
jgi:hypothetical protein